MIMLGRYVSRLNRLIAGGKYHTGHLERLLEEVANKALEQAKQERENRKDCISWDALIVGDVEDENGLRRYSLKTCDDYGTMQPDIKGFWVPVNDVICGNPRFKPKRKRPDIPEGISICC